LNSRQNFEEYSNINIHENQSSVDELFHVSGRVGGQKGKTKLSVVFRYFANAPTNLGENGGNGFLCTKDRFKLIFPLLLTRLLCNVPSYHVRFTSPPPPTHKFY